MSITDFTTTDLNISTARRMWYAHLPGRVVFGNGKMRPCQIVGDKLMHTSVKSANDRVVLLAPGVNAAASGGLGVVKVVQVFYRDTTKERSLAGLESLEVDMAGQCLSVSFEESPHISDKYISHHEFYVQIVSRGGWYRIGTVPYIGDGVTHTWEFPDVSVSQLLNGRPLEDQLQASLYPAVSTATYWNGAVYGAGLEGRRFSGSSVEIALTQGSNLAVITGSTFTDADLYKPILEDGVPVFYVWKVRGSGTVEIKLPYSTSAGSDNWEAASRTLTFNGSSGTVWIGAEEQTVYVSPTYVGEAGNGLTRGLVMWNPLNQLRDEYQASVGSRITAITRDRENLLVFFDKAIVVYQGEPGLDVPQPRAVTVSDCIGTLAQHHVWRTREGSVYWLTRDRIYTLNGMEAMDVTAAWGNASLFSKHFDTNYALNYYNWNVAYNPQTNQTLIVNLSAVGTSEHSPTRASNTGIYGLLMDHGRQAFYKMEFPVRLKAVCCSPGRDGRWGWYGLAVSLAQGVEDTSVAPPYFCELFADTDYQQDSVGVSSDIDYSATSGVRYSPGHSWPQAHRLMMEYIGPGGIRTEGILVEAMVRGGNIRFRGGFSATVSKQVDSERLIMDDWINLPVSKPGTHFQFRWSGTNDGTVTNSLKLLNVTLLSDAVPKRGMDE